jgi:hypothetical protein
MTTPNPNLSELRRRLIDPDFRGPMQHLRNWSELDRLHDEAAQAIRDLEAKVAMAVQALEPFARAAVEAERQTGTNESSSTPALAKAARGETAWADYTRARAALQSNEGGA